MADTPETKVLKDINRHLANMDESGAAESPPEQISIKNMQDIVGNFQSLLDLKLQRIVLTSERAFNQAFGNLQGFNLEQNNAMIAELDNVIDELQINNRLASAADDLQFLREKERDEEVEINKETNELLEDILEKDGMGGGDGGRGLSGLPLEIIGGLLTAMGLKGLGAKLFSKAGLISLGKVLAKSVFAAFSLKNFFEGFMEEKDNEGKSFAARFVSGIGNMLEALSFGLIDDKDIERFGAIIRKKLSTAGADFQKAWDKYWDGGMPLADALADAFSALSLGTLGPKAIKRIGESIEFFVESLGDTVVTTVLGAMGFDVKRFKVSPERQAALKKAADERKEKLKKFKLKQQTEPELEKLFQESGLSMEKKTSLRGILGGKLALFSPGELRQFDESERKKQEEGRIRDRAQWIQIQKTSLEGRIERQKFLDDREKKRDAKELAAKQEKVKSDAMRQTEIENLAAETRALAEARKRTGQGEERGDTFVDAKSTTLGQPDDKTETDDVNLLRNGMFGPISPFGQ